MGKEGKRIRYNFLIELKRKGEGRKKDRQTLSHVNRNIIISI